MSLREQIDTVTGADEGIVRDGQNLQAQIARLDALITTLERKRDADRTACLPDAEFFVISDAVVDDYAEQWARDEGRAFLLSLVGEDLTGLATTRPRPRMPWAPSESMPEGARCYFERETVKANRRAGIKALLATGVLGEPGLPSAQRPAHLAEQEREVSEVKRVRESATDKLIAMGVNILHRPETVERRERERRAAELAAEREREARSLEEARRTGQLGTPRVEHAGSRAVPSPFMRR